MSKSKNSKSHMGYIGRVFFNIVMGTAMVLGSSVTLLAASPNILKTSSGDFGSWILSDGVSVDTNKKNDSDRSLKVVDTTLKSKSLSVSGFTQYLFTAYINKANVDSKADITVADSYKFSLDPSAEADTWVKVEKRFATLNYKALTVEVDVTGEVNIDNISICEVKNDPLFETKTYLSDIEWVDFLNIDGIKEVGFDDDFSGNHKINIGDLASFDKGLRTHPTAVKDAYFIYDLTGGNYTSFRAFVGKSAKSGGGDTQFKVYVDGVLKGESPVMTYNDAYWLDVDVTGGAVLKLEHCFVDNYICDSSVWADAALYSPAEHVTISNIDRNLVCIQDTFKINGLASGDSVNVYIDGELNGSAKVVNQKYYYTLTDLRQKKDTAEITVVNMVGGAETSDNAVAVLKVISDIIDIGDLPFTGVTCLTDTLTRNASLHGKLSIGGGEYVSDKGFEIHPNNGSGKNAYADVKVNIEGCGYTYFESLVGRNSAQGDCEEDDVECIVLADNEELIRSGRLSRQAVRKIMCEIPEGTKYLTLRVTNYDGNYVCGLTNWLNPVLVKDKNVLYRNYMDLYDKNAESAEIAVNGANVHFSALEGFNALSFTVGGLENGEEIIVKIRPARATYDRMLEGSVLRYARASYYGGEVFASFESLPKGEYYITLEGNGTIKSFNSENTYTYANYSAVMKSLQMQIVFNSDTASAYFGTPEKCSFDIVSDMSITDAEMQRVKKQYDGFLTDDLTLFPISFKIGTAEYHGFGKDFTKTNQTTADVDGGVKTITRLMHTSGLEFTVESVYYAGYNAYDWIVYIKNTENKNSPIISSLMAADITLDGINPYLFGNRGDRDPSGAYNSNSLIAPYSVNLSGSYTAKSSGGRSTMGDYPYFNLEYGDKGVLYAVGWPGQWNMTIDNSTSLDKTRLTACQETFASYLKPSETVRTPLMAFVHYDGRSQARATNLWRRWMIDCNVPKLPENEDGSGELKLIEPTFIAGATQKYFEMVNVTEDNQIASIKQFVDNGVQLDYWWMDAGWYFTVNENGDYVTPPDWGPVGTWQMDTNRFPTKLKSVSEYANQNNIKTLLWFEVERVGIPKTLLKKNGTTIDPDWTLSGLLTNLGNPDALKWIGDRIVTVMKEGGISLYREDFNIDPLELWKTGDEDNRSGITENLHVQGHLALWDRIHAEFPNAILDSCASGGNRNDLESMRRAVPLHKTDYNYGDRSGQQAIVTELARWIPYFGTRGVAANMNDPENGIMLANKYSLRTANAASMIVEYDMAMPVDWDIVKDAYAEHEKIGKFIYSDYYVLVERSTSEKDWAGWEYYDAGRGKGYALVFRRSEAMKSNIIKLKGLDSEAVYKVWLEDANMPGEYTGEELMKNGITVSLPCAKSSDIIYIQKATSDSADRALTAKITQVSENGQYRGSILTENGYDRFDIRFNMSLRNTVLENNEGYIETGVQGNYASLITIGGRFVSDLLAEDSESVIMNYNVQNNILCVYVKTGIIDTAADFEVVLSADLTSDGSGSLTKPAVMNYVSQTDAWKCEEPAEEPDFYGELPSGDESGSADSETNPPVAPRKDNGTLIAAVCAAVAVVATGIVSVLLLKKNKNKKNHR